MAADAVVLVRLLQALQAAQAELTVRGNELQRLAEIELIPISCAVDLRVEAKVSSAAADVEQLLAKVQA